MDERASATPATVGIRQHRLTPHHPLHTTRPSPPQTTLLPPTLQPNPSPTPPYSASKPFITTKNHHAHHHPINHHCHPHETPQPTTTAARTKATFRQRDQMPGIKTVWLQHQSHKPRPRNNDHLRVSCDFKSLESKISSFFYYESIQCGGFEIPTMLTYPITITFHLMIQHIHL